MLGQRAAAGPARLSAGALECRIGLLLLGLGFGDRLFDIFQREIELVGIELFRAPAEPQPLQLTDQMAKTIILTGELGLFGALGVAFSTGLGEQRAARRCRSAEAREPGSWPDWTMSSAACGISRNR
jgi:hypothetical protein